MAEWSGPWDGSDFAQEEWRQLFRTMPDVRLVGIGNEDSNFPVNRSDSDRSYTIGPGKAMIQGYLYESDDDIIFNVPVPAGGNQRIDLVVLRLDPSQDPEDRVKMALKQGQESSVPVEPDITREEDGIWETVFSRIGPYGSGPISGAPHVTTLRAAPVFEYTNFSGNPNNQPWRYPGGWRNFLITNDGKMWVFEGDPGAWNRRGGPTYGTISPASGWQAYPGHPPRYRLYDGMVHLKGIFRRSGSTVQFQEAGSAMTLSNTLPSVIRPIIDSSPDSLTLCRVRVGSSTGVSRYGAARVDVSDNRIIAQSAVLGENTWLESGNGWISISSVYWWVDGSG